ncbi:FAD-dependent monooxygenase [Algimonas porphyrae]|uniref:Monooxygenase n=1 Tax=Algimonas porphyrae TaxID=1128113 RepID=A0ABQ5V1I2_9PROT|nr:FAD-dependent monooxygenase [Algimonas porphyrae]GLQ21401.1 monooxygenase [Algimonas porphyrae]
MKVLIAGGGIGGLTTALCCLHHGLDPHIIERAPAISDVGAGIQIPPNAMRIFGALGMTDRIMRDSFAPDAIEARMGRSGRHLFRIPLQDYAQDRWGAPYLHIHRADYVRALADALLERAPNALRLGISVQSHIQSANGVTLQCDNGERVLGDALIGADGIHSAVRTQMLGPDTPCFTGNVAWRAIAPIHALGEFAPPPTACLWMGPNRHAVTYRLRRGELANLVAVVERDDWQGESWSTEGDKADAIADFAGWDPMIMRILEESDTLYRWALFDRDPFPRWTDGSVALLGDAAHPMLPFMAQGAAMAVEDGWAVATELATTPDNVPAALTRYQNRRFARASRVQAGSRANARTFHKSSRPSQLLTYGPMWLAGRILPKAIHARQDWLYSHDETAITQG